MPTYFLRGPGPRPSLMTADEAIRLTKISMASILGPTYHTVIYRDWCKSATIAKMVYLIPPSGDLDCDRKAHVPLVFGGRTPAP